VREELLISVALVLAIVGMAINFGSHYIEGELWMVILGAQAIPYLSALVGALVAHYSREHPAEVPREQPESSRAARVDNPEAIEARTATG
jgi:hypothetical protein